MGRGAWRERGRVGGPGGIGGGQGAPEEGRRGKGDSCGRGERGKGMEGRQVIIVCK